MITYYFLLTWAIIATGATVFLMGKYRYKRGDKTLLILTLATIAIVWWVVTGLYRSNLNNHEKTNPPPSNRSRAPYRVLSCPTVHPFTKSFCNQATDYGDDLWDEVFRPHKSRQNNKSA